MMCWAKSLEVLSVSLLVVIVKHSLKWWGWYVVMPFSCSSHLDLNDIFFFE